MNYKEKKQELEEKFEKIGKEIVILEENKNKRAEELLRLQGEYRLIEEMQKDEKKEEKPEQDTPKTA